MPAPRLTEHVSVQPVEPDRKKGRPIDEQGLAELIDLDFPLGRRELVADDLQRIDASDRVTHQRHQLVTPRRQCRGSEKPASFPPDHVQIDAADYFGAAPQLDCHPVRRLLEQVALQAEANRALTGVIRAIRGQYPGRPCVERQRLVGMDLDATRGVVEP